MREISTNQVQNMANRYFKKNTRKNIYAVKYWVLKMHGSNVLPLIFFPFIWVESGPKDGGMETVVNLACLFLLSHLSIAGRITTSFAIICHL